MNNTPWTVHQSINGACVVLDSLNQIVASCSIYEGYSQEEVRAHAEAIAKLSRPEASPSLPAPSSVAATADCS